MLNKGEASRFHTHAKVNLGLKILGKREDGFHELVTLMQEIDLHDTLEIRLGEKDTLKISGMTLPVDQDNLLFKTLDKVRQRGYRVPSLNMHLYKNIPIGGGLGGGSGNAIGLLSFLAKKIGLEISELHEIASELGSDTNFFLMGGACLCRGRGEKIESVVSRQCYFNLVLPPILCSTPKVFSEVSGETATATVEYEERWCKGKGYGENDLMHPCLQAYPEMNVLFELAQSRGVKLCLSGSGSTCFTFHETIADRDSVGDELRCFLPEVKILPAQSYSRT